MNRQKNNIPVVVPYEYETVCGVGFNGRKLTIQPPRPRVFENVGSSRPWFVDLVKDVKTGRAVKELQLPPGPAVFELLNGPCPPKYEHLALARTGDGSSSINFWNSDVKDVVEIYLPTPEEILEEILWEYEVEPLHDEKRSGYLPVIRKFGGIQSIAAAFTGKSAEILAYLQGEPKTPDQIKSKCKPGKGGIERNIAVTELYYRLESDRIKRIGPRRLRTL